MLPSTGSNFLRLSDGDSAREGELGVLDSLIGTWVGNQGWNIVAVPNGKPHDFLLLVQPYIETLSFSSGGAPAPNRGGLVEQLVGAVTYNQRVTDKETSEPLHFENGMWMYLGNVVPQKTGDSGVSASLVPFPYGRLASIPHGDALLALGNASSDQGGPTISDISTLPFPLDGAPLGYTDPYLDPSPGTGVDVVNPNATLRQQSQGQNILSTTTLAISSANNGGIHNIPFIEKFADCTFFDCTFWIEEVEDQETGSQFLQLQYSQTIYLDFFPQFDDPSKKITWPHVNINTLVKQ